MKKMSMFMPVIALVTCSAVATSSFAQGLSSSARGTQSPFVNTVETSAQLGYHPDCWPASIAAVAAAVYAAAAVVSAATQVYHEAKKPTAEALPSGGKGWSAAVDKAAANAFDRN
jgi:hypothetical protein